MTATVSMVSKAQELFAGRGFHAFPADHPDQRKCIGLHGRGNPCDGQRAKHPAVKFGTWAVTVTDRMIDLGWSKFNGLANVAVACGPSDLVVLDGDAVGEIQRWATAAQVDLPETYTVSTARGEHRYFSWDHDTRKIGNGAKAVKGFKIDVRGAGGYVIAEGSQHVSGVVYTGNGLPVAPLPIEVAEVLLTGVTEHEAVQPRERDSGTVWEEFTGSTEDPNTTKVPMHERHPSLVAYAGRLRSMGLDLTEAVPVYRLRWLLCEQPTGQIPEAKFHSPECPYPVTWDEAEAKLRDVYGRYAAGQPGVDNGGSADTEEPEATTWEPHDLAPWLDGTHVSPKPTVGIARSDGQKLIYAGCEHTVFGETEAGKSWFALDCVAVEIRMGRNVVYIHYEEGDPGSTVERLQLLGVTAAQIRQHLRFVAPGRPVRGAWLAPLLDPPPVLVIHDGINEAMSLQGDDTNQADGAATFRRTIIKPFLAVGAASLSCDHVVKNSEGRGRYAIGSGHKVNAIDGAAFLMENIEPFGRGMRGASSVYVTKDRPGQLRAHGKPTGLPGKTLIGVLAVDATGDSPDFLVFHAPKDGDKTAEQTPGDNLPEEVYRTLVAMPDHMVKSGRELRAAMRDAGIRFTTTAGIAAVDDLLFTGRISEIPGRNKAVGYRALVTTPSVSEQSPSSDVSSGVSWSVSPIGEKHSETLTASGSRNTAKHSETLESDTPESSCTYCGNPIPAHMHSQVARRHCYRPACREAAKGVAE